jgi:hypothetical protein
MPPRPLSSPASNGDKAGTAAGERRHKPAPEGRANKKGLAIRPGHSDPGRELTGGGDATVVETPDGKEAAIAGGAGLMRPLELRLLARLHCPP